MSSFAAGSSSTSDQTDLMTTSYKTPYRLAGSNDVLHGVVPPEKHKFDNTGVLLPVATENSSAVARIESEFLESHFDTALVLANQFLGEEQERLRSANPSQVDIENCRHCTTPICLRCDVQKQSRYIFWKYTKNEESADFTSHVAAIALQSWFELYQQEQQLTRNESCDKGYRFLLPFLETFTSTVPGNILRCRPMSIELLVVFVRFLSSPVVSQEMEGISLTSEFLRHVRYPSSEPVVSPCTPVEERYLSPVDESCCKELIVFLFTELIPRHSMSINAATDVISVINGSLHSEEVNWKGKSQQFTTQANENACPRKDVLQQCLCFCNTDDGNWPRWTQDAFRKCRSILQAKLREIYHRRDAKTDLLATLGNEGSPTNVSLVRRLKSKHFSSNVVSFIGRILSQQLQEIKTVILEGNMNSLTESQKKRIQISCAFACVTLFCWTRYRKQMSKFVQAVLLKALWKPLWEIVQAIKPVAGVKNASFVLN